MANVKLEIPKPITRLLSKPKRIKIAVGGRGSGKSISVGDIMLMFAANGEQVCASREFQNSIDDSVHESLKQEIERIVDKYRKILPAVRAMKDFIDNIDR